MDIGFLGKGKGKKGKGKGKGKKKGKDKGKGPTLEFLRNFEGQEQRKRKNTKNIKTKGLWFFELLGFGKGSFVVSCLLDAW